MDEHNVHNFWGASPFVDLGALAASTAGESAEVALGRLALDHGGGSGSDRGAPEPFRTLQVGAQDCRHTLATLCRAHRHAAPAAAPLEFFVHEADPEVLARHLLLLAVLLDEGYPVRDRVEMFLEVHGNALLSERTAVYLEGRAKAVEGMVMALNAGGAIAEGFGAMLDISMLKFEQRDLLAEALRRNSRKVEYDMAKAWDARVRKLYGDRYDARRNLVDWDYHMRLQQEERKDGMDIGKGHIVHFTHFREWRLHGVAYELRDIVYTEANRSLVSTAYGRTKEFKDRYGADKGRSVSATGYWGDIISSPYHSFGTICEEPKFFKITNKQYTHTAVDVAQFNVTGFLQELRTGEVAKVAEDEEAPRAEASRGVTNQEMMDKAQNWSGEEGDASELQVSMHAAVECC
eukprot:jgi/Tetstr1/429188/TSEL_019141.t1